MGVMGLELGEMLKGLVFEMWGLFCRCAGEWLPQVQAVGLEALQHTRIFTRKP